MDKIVVFGSTGMTGLCVVESALKKGIQVRVLVRDPTRLPDHIRQQVEVFQGNTLNYDDVLKAVKDIKAVVCTLGTGTNLQPTTDLSNSLKNILKAMQETNVEIISVCLSAFLFPEYSGDKTPQIFRDLTEDHRRMYEALKESNLKYIAVFPPHIAGSPESSYKVGHDQYQGRAVSKYDLGRFLVDSLEQPEHYCHVCGIVSV
ncbi:flavin reductase (NADPH) [Sitophilus oryzae]|uniref:Flavin reductase (NADPH) n=1 Tax=Sitophilus oryzae TaxID=7048 RepID=A0A6J2XB72_SITOR|nr:flavin reductase (NADPH) [Sitophilus oryzae]